MYRKLCCFGFSNENKCEKYKKCNGEFTPITLTHGLSINEFVLQGVNTLPNEIIVEYLFPQLGTDDIRNLGDTGDSRLKCLAKDYLSGSK